MPEDHVSPMSSNSLLSSSFADGSIENVVSFLFSLSFFCIAFTIYAFRATCNNRNLSCSHKEERKSEKKSVGFSANTHTLTKVLQNRLMENTERIADRTILPAGGYNEPEYKEKPGLPPPY